MHITASASPYSPFNIHLYINSRQVTLLTHHLSWCVQRHPARLGQRLVYYGTFFMFFFSRAFHQQS